MKWVLIGFGVWFLVAWFPQFVKAWIIQAKIKREKKKASENDKWMYL